MSVARRPVLRRCRPTVVCRPHDIQRSAKTPRASRRSRRNTRSRRAGAPWRQYARRRASEVVERSWRRRSSRAREKNWARTHYVDSSVSDIGKSSALGGATVVLATAPVARAWRPPSRTARGGGRDLLGASDDQSNYPAFALLFQSLAVEGSVGQGPSGRRRDAPFSTIPTSRPWWRPWR